MERIVYLLGAGFSQPLGLPLISDFREKSQELYQRDARYKYFEDIFLTIRNLAHIKNYYNSDLSNIEEVLSLLTMGDFLDRKPLGKQFIKYIQDVINGLTPRIPIARSVPERNWQMSLFGGRTVEPPASNWIYYGHFIGALMGAQFRLRTNPGAAAEIQCGVRRNTGALYSIVTLNYDRVPEMVAEYCAEHYKCPVDDLMASPCLLRASKTDQLYPFAPDAPVYIAKLHGCVGDETIIAPTWSKGADPEIIPEWNAAYKMLSEATQIRIIGFSLPLGDAYVKYLLKSATIDNDLLKRIDVICLDRDGTVFERYKEFVAPNRLRFANADCFSYLVDHYSFYRDTELPSLDLDMLENVHDNFMKSRVGRPRVVVEDDSI